MRSFVGLFIWLWPMFTLGMADEPDRKSETLFARRISPLLTEKCVACHGGDRAEIAGGLDLRLLESTLRGGDSGQPALVPNSAATSPIFLAATRAVPQWSAMPPKESEALSDEQLSWLRQWIDSGAVWLEPAKVAEIQKANQAAWSNEDGVTVATSGGSTSLWSNRRYLPEGLWAYQPLETPKVTTDSIPNAIDQLIQAKIPQELVVAPLASRPQLVRRAFFDLLGLPPTVNDVEAFVADPRDDRTAFSELVDRLLNSPHYGERMARHWLDVVRYADSSGLANDYQRGNAWRYRDYVVRAFNHDKPYNEFVREQIAGDEIDPQDPEKIIATGFLRMGPWELTGMEVPKIARQRFLDDVTNSIGETFLAHSLQCARCHDHKFDPIPTQDYYSIQAVFANTQLADRNAEFLQLENQQDFDEQKYLEMRRDDHQRVIDRLDDLLLANAKKWFEDNNKPIENWNEAVEKARGSVGKRGIFNAARNLLLKQNVPEADFPPKLVGFSAQEFGLERVARKGIERLAWEMERYKPFALAVYNGPNSEKESVTSPMRMPKEISINTSESTAVLIGGDPFSPSQLVRPGVLSALASFAKSEHAIDALHPKIPETSSGRRLAFANWVSSPHNPLTSRTIVNRLWLWHFGRPIAGNPNNFGSTGKPPTHPELLDYLASTLIENGWSIKLLHRSIMLSETYRRSSIHPTPDLVINQDPFAKSYVVFGTRRLSSDEIRDAMLSATGELNPTLGGIPNCPEINLEAALQPRQVMGTFAAAWVPNPQPKQRHRRSIYALKLRGLVDPFQDVFNAPAADFSCEQRECSTVTPQVFSLLNSRSSSDRALALANRAVEAGGVSELKAMDWIYKYALGRSPNEQESSRGIQFWHAAIERLREVQPRKIELPSEVVRTAVEENTGEPFTFTERLYAYDDFILDLQPTDVSPEIRALADLGLVLLNSNEFMYVD